MACPSAGARVGRADEVVDCLCEDLVVPDEVDPLVIRLFVKAALLQERKQVKVEGAVAARSRPVAHAGRERPIDVVGVVGGEHELPQRIAAANPRGRLPNPLDGRQQQIDEDGNDGHHYDEFDERKRTRCFVRERTENETVGYTAGTPRGRAGFAAGQSGSIPTVSHVGGRASAEIARI